MTHIDRIDDIADAQLARRLRALVIAAPGDLVTLAAVGAAPHRRLALRRRVTLRAVAAAVSLCVLSLGTGAASYFDPSFAQALAAAPGIGAISGPALAAAGLSAGQVAPLHEVGSAAGVTATLSGAYADGLQTTLFVDVEGLVSPPAPTSQNPHPVPSHSELSAVRSVSHGMTLTDQFGTTYELAGGEGLGVGPYPVIFGPLRGVAASVGARFSLAIPVFDGFGNQLGVIVLHATLLPPSSASDVRSPAPITIDGTTYRIADMHVSENAIEVHTEISGALIDSDVEAQQRLNPASGVGGSVCYPGVFLEDSSGTYQIPIAELNQDQISSRLTSDHVLDETRLFARMHSGPYRIVVSGGGCSSAAPSQEPGLASWSFSG